METMGSWGHGHDRDHDRGIMGSWKPIPAVSPGNLKFFLTNIKLTNGGHGKSMGTMGSWEHGHDRDHDHGIMGSWKPIPAVLLEILKKF